MSNHIKILRGQLRQLVKEMLPVVVTDETMKTIESKLREELNKRLDAIDKRQAEIQGFVVRNAANTLLPKETDVK